MGASTAAGAKILIGTTASVAATDTFVEIGEVVTIPEFGRSYNEIKHNPLSSRGTQKFKGSYDDGSITISLGKDASDAGQAAVIAALDIDSDYNFKVVANDGVAALSILGVSISAATPGVVTSVAHDLAVNTAVKFTAGAGTLPTGIVAGTTYYVKTVLSADTFSVSATPGGAAIATTGSPSGTYTMETVPAGTYQLFKAKVMSYTTNIGSLDDIIKASVMLGIKSGSIVETARIPAA